MDIHALNETEVRSQYISPAIARTWTNWVTQVREEVYLTDGRIIVRGRLHTQGKRKFADYVLYHKPNIPLAVVEAKDATHTVGDGMQQALEYAEMLDVPFVFSSNGKGFLFHDKTATDGNLEQELPLDEFPSPGTLWRKYCAWKGLSPAETGIVEQSYHSDGSDRAPRYYQVQAINRTVEAIAKGQQRILLVMATGTGKT
jgi:type I restriction enzyme, R subunit